MRPKHCIKHMAVWALLLVSGLVACNGTLLAGLKATPSAPASLSKLIVVTSTQMPVRPTHAPKAAPSQPPAPSPSPVQNHQPSTIARYRLVVDLDYAQHIANVSQTIAITNNSPDSWDSIVFQAPMSRVPGVFVINEARWLTEPYLPTTYAIDAATLTYHFDLPRPLLPREDVGLVISYTLRVPPTSLKDWPPTGDLGYNAHVMQFGNWYPVLVPYSPHEGWYTWPFTEVGDPYVTVIADYDLEIHAPEPIVVAAGGIPEHQPGRWHFHLDQARAIGFSASPEYHMVHGTADGVSVYSYYLTGHEQVGRDVLTATLGSLQLFGQLYGPYPYPSFTIAEDAFFGSMEYTAFVLHSGAGYAEYNGRPDSMLIALTPHEIAHQWWYSLVGTDQVKEPWLDEGLAMYSELAFYREYYPELEDWFWASRVNIYHPTGSLTRSIYDFPDSQTYIHQLYRRGVQLFDTLRQGLGRDRFYAFLRSLRQLGEQQFVTTDQFFQVLDRYSPGRQIAGIAEYFPNRVGNARATTTVISGVPTTTLAAGHPTAVPQIIYVVRDGDTLWNIAIRFDVSVEALMNANHLSDSNIYAGQTLTIPGR
jgi:hypothetical protein